MAGRRRGRRLTAATAGVLESLHRMIEREGYAPTIRELAAEANFSRTGVEHHVNLLVMAGYVDRDPARARSMVITPEGEEYRCSIAFDSSPRNQPFEQFSEASSSLWCYPLPFSE